MMENMLKEHPKVSVIIPVYGVEAFIERCARALFEQTLDSIEYLFIDDCTPDRSIDILKQVLQEYPQRAQQVTMHRMEQNSGQAKVREWGIRNATGEYVIHCDTDDWPEVEQYQEMYKAAIENDADIVFCDYNRVSPNGEVIYYSRQLDCRDSMSMIDRMMSINHNANQLWANLVKKALLSNISFPKGDQGEDFVIMLQVIYEAKKMYYLQEALYNYYLNPNSMVRTVDSSKVIHRCEHYQRNLSTIIDFLSEHKLCERYSQHINALKYYSRVILWVCIDRPECKALWKATYPEIDGKILFNKYIPFRYKCMDIILSLHIDGIINIIKKGVK